MTPQQTTAYRRPCRRAEETAHPRYGPRRVDRGYLMLATKLTVNMGRE